MSIESADPRNADQIAYWDGPGGRNWVNRMATQEEMLEPVTAALVARAGVKAGERVIDTGCGTGATTLALARLVGPSGRVLGIDVSQPMLACANERSKEGLDVSFERADATTHAFPRGGFDLLFSRFGVMFFAEPAHSFANLRTALRAGGRLVFACWRKGDENPWLTLPLAAASAHLPPQPKPGPDDPGPLSFAREERVRRILGDAGFQAIGLEPVDFEFDASRGGGLDAAVSAAIAFGPASRVLEGQPAAIRAAAAASIRSALAPYQRGASVPLAAAIWVVTATNQ
jgi:SAM-dependent methyltransferase